MEAPNVKLTFVLEGGSKRTVSVPWDVAMMIPAIKAFLESDDGKTGKRYTFEFQTTENAIKVLFQWKTSLIDSTKKWSSSGIDVGQLCEAAVLAEQLGDDSFADYMIDVVPIDQIDDISVLPQALVARYAENYIRDCFFPACGCDAGAMQEDYDTAKEWFKTLQDDDQIRLIKIYRTYLIVRGLPSHEFTWNNQNEKIAIREFLKEVGPDVEEKYRNEKFWWNWGYASDLYIVDYDYRLRKEGGKKIAEDWYAISVEQRWMLISYLNVEQYYEEIPDCECVPSFHEGWTEFYSKNQEFARCIWENTPRMEFLKATNVPKRRMGSMEKADFGTMVAYIERTRPKGEVSARDPVERGLKAALRSAKKGTPVGNRGVRYISSEEVAEAQARLDKYLAEKKRTTQSAKSKEAVREAQQRTYTTPTQIALSVKSIQKHTKNLKQTE